MLIYICMGAFKLVSPFKPEGDQPKAIDALVGGVNEGHRHQTLLGVTGSGKTFTMANVIARVQRPTLVIAHNKTLAAQLCSEFREFFPENAVEYFVSYYDYYQPEAYIPQSDIYIEKDSSINDEIDRLRHSATQALLTRRDVIVVASVSCIYNLGSPEAYMSVSLNLKKGQRVPISHVMRKLVDMQYERNQMELKRGTFCVRGDALQIFQKDQSNIIMVEFFGDDIEKMYYVDPLKKQKQSDADEVHIFPARHFVSLNTGEALKAIEKDMEERVAVFKSEGKLLEAQRIEQRTHFDMEMIKELGYCNGIENYSRYFDGRKPGQPPCTLISYFPEDFITFIDESHVTLPQLHGMYEGDKSRKGNLVMYGFRLPSALDNRPLRFEEFENAMNQMLFTSATPGPYEYKMSAQIAEQIIRPTGLVDPELEVRPAKTQVDDLVREVKAHAEKKERVLVTTLTKKMAENLTEYLVEAGIKARYLHSDIDTLERVEILRQLRLGEFDALIGINLLREGLDLPEVTLVAILDADKEGFLRSQTSLIQTMGRAARNVNGNVILYADHRTRSMTNAIQECERRRKRQLEYNAEYNITPETIRKDIRDIAEGLNLTAADSRAQYMTHLDKEFLMADTLEKTIFELERKMKKAAEELEFEKAAMFRDEVQRLKKKAGFGDADGGAAETVAKKKGFLYSKSKLKTRKRG